MCYPQGMDATESAALTPPVEQPRAYRRVTPEIVQAVAQHIEAGLTREEIAALPGMPSARTIETVIAADPEIAAMRACGRVIEADRLVAEGLALIDAPIEDPDTASAEVARAKNRFEARKWLAGCWHRDLYGDRPPQVNVQVNTVSAAFGRLSSPKSDAADE